MRAGSGYYRKEIFFAGSPTSTTVAKATHPNCHTCLQAMKLSFTLYTKAPYRAANKMNRSQPLASNLGRKNCGIKELQTRPSPFVQNKQNPFRQRWIYFCPASLLQNVKTQLEKSPFVFSFSILQSGTSLLELSPINTKAKTVCLCTMKFTVILRDTNLDSSFHGGDC